MLLILLKRIESPGLDILYDALYFFDSEVLELLFLSFHHRSDFLSQLSDQCVFILDLFYVFIDFFILVIDSFLYLFDYLHQAFIAIQVEG